MEATNSSQFDKLGPAIVAFQGELSPVEKSAANPFFKSKYAPLPEVRQALQPILAKHKLALLSFPSIVEGRNGLKFYLMHESGQHITGEWMLNPVKNDPQAEGSATTYMRRYGDMAITGMVADDDDDANAASGKQAARAPQATEASNYAASPLRTPSDKQKTMIKYLSEGLGYDQAWIDNTMSKVKTSADASALIDKLQSQTNGGQE